MAKAPAKQEAPAATAAPKSSKKWLIIILAVVLLLVVLGGGAAFLLLKKSHSNGDSAHAESAAKKSEEQPVFVRLETFTVGLQPDTEKQGQYLQVVPELKVGDKLVEEKIKGYLPEIRYKTILLLSSKKPSELSTPQGVEKLSYELRNNINQILGGKPPAGAPAATAGANEPVQAVVFTSFIIQ